MSFSLRIIGMLGLASIFGLLTAASAGADESLAGAATALGPRLTLALPDGQVAHLFPTVKLAAQLRSQLKGLSGLSSSSQVTYHGGRIMPAVNIYAIFWVPPRLQNGTATSMPASYKNVVSAMLSNYAGHSIANINTQYYQSIAGVKTYHSGAGSYAGNYVDTAAYPASDCIDAATPGNCISDKVIKVEIKKVMAIKHWTPGIDKIFMVFTTAGEGSCVGTDCSYTRFCAYHSAFGTAAAPIIYSNEPYGNNETCQATDQLPNPGTADSAVTAARHEISEATSDPLFNGWWDSMTGEETSDKCNFDYGPLTWDNVNGVNLANYMWGGNYFLMQREYSVHSQGCVTEGP